MNRLACAVTAVLLAAGCSSSSGTAKTSSIDSPTTQAATAATPTPTLTSASPADTVNTEAQLRKWAGLVLSLERPVRQAQSKIARCSSFDYTESLACSLGQLTFTINTETFALRFKDEGDQLDGLPNEIADLVITTQTDALKIEGLQKQTDKHCHRVLTQSCESALFAWGQGRDSLIEDFDKWKPYIG